MVVGRKCYDCATVGAVHLFVNLSVLPDTRIVSKYTNVCGDQQMHRKQFANECQLCLWHNNFVNIHFYLQMFHRACGKEKRKHPEFGKIKLKIKNKILSGAFNKFMLNCISLIIWFLTFKHSNGILRFFFMRTWTEMNEWNEVLY